MRRQSPALLLGVGLLLVGCGSLGQGLPRPGGPLGDVIVVGDDQDRDRDRGRGGGERAGRVDVPPGHYPPPGECRIWYPGTPPGQQPPPARCDRLGRVPYGAFILYGGREWDTRYDWEAEERRSRGSVPSVILGLMRSLSR